MNLPVAAWLRGYRRKGLRAEMIERSPLGAALGRERMFFNLHKVLEAWQHSVDRSSSTAH